MRSNIQSNYNTLALLEVHIQGINNSLNFHLQRAQEGIHQIDHSQLHPLPFNFDNTIPQNQTEGYMVDPISLPFDIFLNNLDDYLQNQQKSRKRVRMTLKICRNKRSCVICQDIIKRKSVIFNLDCRHIFHNKCLGKWLAKSGNCPLCRKQIR